MQFFQHEKSFVSQAIRHWFNRNRSQKEEAHLDISDITRRLPSHVSNRSDFSHVVARQRLGERVAQQHRRRGAVSERDPYGSLLGVVEPQSGHLQHKPLRGSRLLQRVSQVLRWQKYPLLHRGPQSLLDPSPFPPLPT